MTCQCVTIEHSYNRDRWLRCNLRKSRSDFLKRKAPTGGFQTRAACQRRWIRAAMWRGLIILTDYDAATLIT